MANLELGERFLLPVLMRLRQEKETSTTERISRERIRPLWVYILDPAEMGLRHGGTLLSVPWEPLKPGPHGRRFKVDPTVSLSMLKMLDWSERRSLSQLAKPLNLNDPALAAAGGLPPTTGDPQFAAQMTYAVCENVFQTFRQALGREPTFGPWLKRSIDAGGRTELLGEPEERVVLRQEHRERRVRIRSGGGEVGEREHGLGDDVVVGPTAVEAVGVVLGRIGQQDVGERGLGTRRCRGRGSGDDAEGGGEADEEGLAHEDLLDVLGRDRRLTVRGSTERCGRVDARVSIGFGIVRRGRREGCDDQMRQRPVKTVTDG